MTSVLEKTIRDKLLGLTQARIQNDLERMARDLRQQGATDEHIRECVDWFADENQRVIFESAHPAAKQIRAEGFDEKPKSQA